MLFRSNTEYFEFTKVRFYGAGEYGEKMNRPHYHVILFGFEFPDKEFHHVSDPKKKNRFSTSGVHRVYTSEFLSTIWTKGLHTIGEVTLESAGYTARYIGKRIGGEKAKDHYKGLEPEFALMSRRPGVGRSWIEKYLYDLYPKDYLLINGRKYPAPRYFDNYLMRVCFDTYMDVKIRREMAVRNDDIIRRRQKDKYLKEVTKDMSRSYEEHTSNDERILP